LKDIKFFSSQFPPVSERQLLLERSQASHFVLFIRAIFALRWLWNIGELIFIVRNRNSRGEISPSATLSTTTNKQIHLVWNPGLRDLKQPKNFLTPDLCQALHAIIDQD